MKYIASILFLGVLAFTMFGYRIYFNIAENNSTAVAKNKIQKNDYNTADLVTYKFSAKQLPYYTNSKNYEIANGEVDVNGSVMTYVKKRIYKDSIEYVCLPNNNKTQIRNARDEFFKLVNDLNNLAQDKPSKKQANTIVKPFSFEATTLTALKWHNQSLIIKIKKEYSDLSDAILPKPYLIYSTPPPDVA